MAADNGAAAVVALERRQLGEEAGGEDARVAAHAAVPHRDDAVGMPAEKFDLRTHALAPQQRLVGDLIENGVTVCHRLGAEPDGVARAPLREGVDKDGKAEAPGKHENLVVLRDDGHAGKFLAGDSLERVLDEHLPSTLAASLLEPKRLAFPAAMIRRPILGGWFMEFISLSRLWLLYHKQSPQCNRKIHALF